MKTREYIDKVFLFILIIIVLGGYIKPIIKPLNTIKQENRTANKLPTFSIESYFNKRFQDKYEKAYADQIPLASKMKTTSKDFTIATKKAYYKLFSKDFYNNLDGRVYMIDDYLVYMHKDLNELKKIFDKRVKNINLVSDTFKDIPVYLYYIERDSDVNFENNSKNGAYEYLISNLSKNIKSSKFEINNLEEYKKYFYKADHHWNYKGTQKAYEEIVNMIYGNSKTIKPNEELCMPSVVNGSKTRILGTTKFFKEQFCAYTYPLSKHEIYVNGEKAEYYGAYDSLIKQKPKSISYGAWYGGDAGLLEYDYKDSKKDNLLIFGDSYDNGINELLASSFNKTFIVDLRNYERDNGKVFSIQNFVSDNDIDKILFIGSNSYYNNEEFIVGGIE